ncbi:MAG: nitroreductase family protein [Oscillibacter sp.]|nr:nitroreductase family protein [Oscillibacter sp.]
MNEIFKRVSIRRYQDRAVEPEKITLLLRAAMAAPSAVNQRPWEFYVVTNRDKIRELSKCSPYSKCAAGAPAVIVPCWREQLPAPELALIDMAIATEHILLEITSQGLGGVWLALAPFEDRMRKAEAVLEIGGGLHAFAMVAFGYPAEDRPQRDRFEEGRIHYVT